MAACPRWLEARFLAGARRERLAAPVYAAMVDNLFGTLVGFVALGFASVLLAILTFATKPGVVTAAMLVGVVTIVGMRTLLMIAYHRWRRRGETRVRDIVDWEIIYAIMGIALMAMIGALCAYNIVAEKGELVLLVSLIVEMGIAGGIAARNGSRPTIVRLQLFASFAPSLVALLMRQTVEAYVLAGLIVLFVLATLSSVRSVYATLRTALDGELQTQQLSQRLERSNKLFDAALNNMTSGLLLFDSERRLVIANERVKDLFGRDFVEAMIGRQTPEISAALYDAFALDAAEGETITARFNDIMASGGEGALMIVDRRRQRTFEMRLRVMDDGRAVFNVDDVTDQRAKDREIFRLAHYDLLTGLHNRVSLAARLRTILAEAKGGRVVVMYLDLDRFKEVNDDLGHAAGDEVLIEVARRLSACVRPDDFVARIGGDEFVLVFAAVEDEPAVDRLAQRLIATTSAAFNVSGRKISLGASAGLCFATGTGEAAVEETLRLADVALYEAKFRGRGQAVWFEPGMDDRIRRRRDMVAELREAVVTGDGLTLHYQPVVDCRTGRIVACEALMRWTHRAFGTVAPSTFIPLAEENGLILALGRWGLARACADALAWPDPAVRVAVNVSGLQLQQDTMAAVVAEVLARTGLPAERLELEVTESVLAEDLQRMTVELEALADMGVSIALDDFGTGFSSLSLVHKLPFDKVKLDRSFVAQLEADPTVVSLIASIIQMMQVMRKVVVIEGVETAQQLALVASGHGRLIQGYYFSPPVPQVELLPLFERALVGERVPFKRWG